MLGKGGEGVSQSSRVVGAGVGVGVSCNNPKSRGRVGVWKAGNILPLVGTCLNQGCGHCPGRWGIKLQGKKVSKVGAGDVCVCNQEDTHYLGEGAK